MFLNAIALCGLKRFMASSLAMLVVLPLLAGCSDTPRRGGHLDAVSALVVPCEPSAYEPCIGAPKAPGGTIFESISAKIYYYGPSGYVGAANHNMYAVSTINGGNNWEPMGVYSGPSSPKWVGVCWTTNPNCVPRNPSPSEANRFYSLANALNASRDPKCIELGNMALSRILDEAMGGQRAFFMFDKAIYATDEDGTYGQLMGTNHFRPAAGDLVPGEMGVYTGQNAHNMETTMIHEIAHYVFYRDRHAEPNIDAQAAAVYCMGVIGH